MGQTHTEDFKINGITAYRGAPINGITAYTGLQLMG